MTAATTPGLELRGIELHYGFVKALDGIEVSMAHSLRAMAHHQLRAMSYCYGHHDI